MHGTDYAYHFGWPRDYQLYGNNPPVADIPAHRELSNAMRARLISFVHSGDPNNVKGECPVSVGVDMPELTIPDKNIPNWPLYSVKDPKNMVWNATNTLNVRLEPDTWRKEGMELWVKNPTELVYTR